MLEGAVCFHFKCVLDFVLLVPERSEVLSASAVILTVCVSQGQGAITEKLRSLSMHDLTQINQQDDRGGNQLYQYSSHSANPAIRRSQSTDAADGAGKHTHTHGMHICFVKSTHVTTSLGQMERRLVFVFPKGHRVPHTRGTNICHNPGYF